MRCEAVRDALPSLVAGTATDAESAALREHIGGCDACAAEARIAQALVEARGAAGSRAPAGLAERVSAEMERGAFGAGRARHGLPRVIRWSAGAALAVAAMIALILVWPEPAQDSGGIVSGVDGAAAAGAASAPAEGDPFLDDELFAEDAVPLDAELDHVLEGVDPSAPLAMDIGSPLRSWPGADEATAGAVLLDELTYDELRLLLSEMDT